MANMATFIFHCICILAFCGIINCLDDFKYRTLSRKIDTVRNALKKYSSLESDVESMKFELMDLKVELQDEKALTLKLLKQLNTSQAKVQLLTKDDLPGAEDVHQTADDVKSDFTASYSDEMKSLSKEMMKLKVTHEETMNITYMFIKEQKLLIREIQLNVNDTSNNLTELETLTHQIEGKLQRLQHLTSKQQTNDKVINQSTKIITNAFLDEKEKRKELEKRMLYIINETNENMSKLEKHTDNTTTEIKHQLIILEGAIESQVEKDERKELEKRMLYIINETNENMSKLEKRTNNATTETNHQLIILKDAIESQDCNGFFQTNAIYTAPAYQNNRYCIIIVSNTQLPDHKIRVKFNTFELEESLDCRFDYLKLLAGEKEGSPEIFSSHCGTSLEGKVIVNNGSSLRLEFKTDASLALHGFQANISFVQKTCPAPYTNGTVAPRKPIYYQDNVVTIRCPFGFKVLDGSILTCKDERWSHSGMCVPETCPAPDTNGTVEPRKTIYYHNNVVLIRCPSGLTVKGGSYLRCRYKRWSRSGMCVPAFGLSCRGSGDCRRGRIRWLQCRGGRCRCKLGLSFINNACERRVIDY